MAANNKNHKDGNRSGGFKNIGGTYKKYVAAGAMLALLAVVISNSKVTSNDAKKPQDGLFAETTGDEENTEPFEVDAYPQVNELAEEYFRYYADGDVDAIAKIAHPITETEKSYIKMFSNYLDSYEDIKCYTKKGIEDGEYIVSVTCDMKFQGIDSSAPQIHRFYIRKDEDGTAYIDNAYSQFNQSRQENKTDESINALLAAYEQSKDVISLQKEIKREYDSVLEKDEELKTMVMATMQDAISEWVASFEPQTSEDDNQSQTDKKDTDQTDQLERTAYAKTDVNLREKRSTESDVIKTIKEGAKVTIVGVSKDGWFQIKNGSDTGFVKKEYIESEDAPESGSEDETPADQTQTRTAYAKTKVNLRKKRSTDSEVIKTLKAGTKVTIYGTSQDGWFKVKTGGDTGYVSKEYITTDPSKVEQTSASSNTKTRTAYAKTKVNLRKKRSTSSGIIKTLKAGTKVTIYGTSQNGWFKVKTGGDTGYVSKEYITTDPSKVEQTSASSNTKTRTAYAKTKVNLREKRSTSSDILKTLKAGTKVTVYGSSKNGWYKVKAGGKTGYVRTEYIVSSQSKVEKEENTNERTSASRYLNEGDMVRLSESVNVRRSMSESADRVGLAYEGDVVTVIMSYAEGWTKVSWNGQTGYVKTEFLR